MSRRRWVAALAVAVLVFAEFSNRSGVHAFDLPQHERVTRAVLEPYRATINGRERAFTEDAIKEIVKNNWAVDDPPTYAWKNPPGHFTNESFVASSQNLVTLKGQILDLLRRPQPEGKAARIALGRAFHGIQDFYSHSNWVEMGREHIETRFGNTTIEPRVDSLRACPTDPSVLGPNGGGGTIGNI